MRYEINYDKTQASEQWQHRTNQQRKSSTGYFLVLDFLLELASLSSPWLHSKWCISLEHAIEDQFSITFRFVPFPLAAPLPFPLDDSSSFLGDLGFTEKNPSRRPCCLALRNLDNFSAPFFTRSSLSKQNRHHQRSPIYRVMIIGVLEAFFGYQELYETVNIWVLPLQLRALLRSYST